MLESPSPGFAGLDRSPATVTQHCDVGSDLQSHTLKLSLTRQWIPSVSYTEVFV
jgi:hypothetical protein